MFECGVKRKRGSEELHYQYVIHERNVNASKTPFPRCISLAMSGVE